MGLGGISIWQLLIILAIVAMLFGTKKLGNLGSDLGSAIKGFKSGINGQLPDEQNIALETHNALESESRSKSVNS